MQQRLPLPARQVRLVIAADRLIYRIARRWVWGLNVVGAIFVALPILAPILAAHGQQSTAGWIYRSFHLLCHQEADRSFHIQGYKMAYCERDFAIYAGILLLGLAFGVSGRHVRPARLIDAIVLSAPMAIDGVTQLAGLRESTWELRVATGALFAVAVAWFVFPRLEHGFAEIRQVLETRFDRLVREGRAAPL
jgi:uncharacterized membrane protein